MKDILIIGGGPAGLTAAIYAARAGRTAAIYEKETVGGQIVFSPMVENFPAVPHVTGADLAARMEEQAASFGTEFRYAEVTAIRRTPDGFFIEAGKASDSAPAVILAAGVAHKGLGLPDEEDLIGLGVAFCAVCDGAFYRGRDVIVVGGGDAALQDALFLSGLCRRVTMVLRRDVFRGEAMLVDQVRNTPNIRVLLRRRPLAYLTEDGIACGLRVLDLATGREEDLPAACVFLAVGQKPQNEAVQGLLELTPEGYVPAGENALTPVPGLFAAGDCRRKTVRQLTTAVSDGASAALAACDYLKEFGF